MKKNCLTLATAVWTQKEKDKKLEEKYIRPKTAHERYGIGHLTLNRWAKAGKIRSIRIGDSKFAAHRYHEEDLRRAFGQGPTRKEAEASGRETIIYGRVSSSKQKSAGDLDRQLETLKSYCPNYSKIITDVGSGLNFHRRGLLALLDAVEGGRVSKVVVTHRDRLARFGLELIERTFAKHGCTLDVVSHDGTGSDDDELAADLFSICNFFVAKNNGRRAAAHSRDRRVRSAQAPDKRLGVRKGHQTAGRARQDREDQTPSSER